MLPPDSALPAGVGAAFDPTTWQMLSSGPDVVDLAAAYAAASRSGTLPMTFVVDRFGRIAGIFHGSAFGQVNMLLYINGLTNEHEKREPTFWQRVWVAFQ